jgi:uncharacterized protein YuzE
MRIEYDRDTDAAYIYFQEDVSGGGVSRTISVDPQAINGMVNLDLDDDGRILGLEVLDASKLLPQQLLDDTRP